MSSFIELLELVGLEEDDTIEVAISKLLTDEKVLKIARDQIIGPVNIRLLQTTKLLNSLFNSQVFAQRNVQKVVELRLARIEAQYCGSIQKCSDKMSSLISGKKKIDQKLYQIRQREIYLANNFTRLSRSASANSSNWRVLSAQLRSLLKERELIKQESEDYRSCLALAKSELTSCNENFVNMSTKFQDLQKVSNDQRGLLMESLTSEKQVTASLEEKLHKERLKYEKESSDLVKVDGEVRLLRKREADLSAKIAQLEEVARFGFVKYNSALRSLSKNSEALLKTLNLQRTRLHECDRSAKKAVAQRLEAMTLLRDDLTSRSMCSEELKNSLSKLATVYRRKQQKEQAMFESSLRRLQGLQEKKDRLQELVTNISAHHHNLLERYSKSKPDGQQINALASWIAQASHALSAQNTKLKQGIRAVIVKRNNSLEKLRPLTNSSLFTKHHDALIGALRHHWSRFEVFKASTASSNRQMALAIGELRSRLASGGPEKQGGIQMLSALKSSLIEKQSSIKDLDVSVSRLRSLKRRQSDEIRRFISSVKTNCQTMRTYISESESAKKQDKDLASWLVRKLALVFSQNSALKQSLTLAALNIFNTTKMDRRIDEHEIFKYIGHRFTMLRFMQDAHSRALLRLYDQVYQGKDKLSSEKKGDPKSQFIEESRSLLIASNKLRAHNSLKMKHPLIQAKKQLQELLACLSSLFITLAKGQDCLRSASLLSITKMSSLNDQDRLRILNCIGKCCGFDETTQVNKKAWEQLKTIEGSLHGCCSAISRKLHDNSSQARNLVIIRKLQDITIRLGGARFHNDSESTLPFVLSYRKLLQTAQSCNAASLRRAEGAEFKAKLRTQIDELKRRAQCLSKLHLAEVKTRTNLKSRNLVSCIETLSNIHGNIQNLKDIFPPKRSLHSTQLANLWVLRDKCSEIASSIFEFQRDDTYRQLLVRLRESCSQSKQRSTEALKLRQDMLKGVAARRNKAVNMTKYNENNLTKIKGPIHYIVDILRGKLLNNSICIDDLRTCLAQTEFELIDAYNLLKLKYQQDEATHSGISGSLSEELALLKNFNSQKCEFVEAAEQEGDRDIPRTESTKPRDVTVPEAKSLHPRQRTPSPKCFCIL